MMLGALIHSILAVRHASQIMAALRLPNSNVGFLISRALAVVQFPQILRVFILPFDTPVSFGKA